jgi:hypothetical protein
MFTEDLLDADWIPLPSFQKAGKFVSVWSKEKGWSPLHLFNLNGNCAILNRKFKWISRECVRRYYVQIIKYY